MLRTILLSAVVPATTVVFAALSPAFLQSQSDVLSSSASSSVGSGQAPAAPLAAVNGPTELFSVVEDSANDKTRFELTDSAKAVFQQLTGPVYVVGIHGEGRLGKSTNLSFFVREW